ncbi:MAG TPA: hypothetical protein PLV92_04850, partial [Pirellulaceae bacterium]|nr:hypothetical protein [Pirellulaceae bacterium]
MADLTIDKPALQWQLTMEGSWPMAVAFVGSGRRLVAGNQDGEIYLWELPETPPPLEGEKKPRDREAPGWAPVKKLVGHTNGITRLLALPDGRHVVSASLDHSIRVWDVERAASGEAEVVLDRETRESEFKRTRKDEVLKAPGVKVGVIECEHVLSEHRDWVHSLCVSADGKRMISGDASAQIVTWDLEQRKVLASWKGRPWNWIVAAALTPAGDTAVVSEYRYKRDDFDIPAAALKSWDAATGAQKLDILQVQFPKLKPDETSYEAAQMWRKFVANGLITADISPDGKLVAVGQGGETDTGKVHLLEIETGKLVRSVSNHQYGVTDARFSTCGKFLLSSGRDTTVRITKVEDGQEATVLGKPRGGQFKDWISALALSPDQKHVAGADIAGLVQV